MEQEETIDRGEMVKMAKENKNSIKMPEPRCEKCGKLAPIDKEKSNENWTAYVMGKPCECGGTFKLKFLE